MTDRGDSDRRDTDWRDTVEPEAGGGAERVADEQLVHGLLEFLARDDARGQSRRVEQVMRAIGGADPAAPAPLGQRVPWALVAMLLAAVLVVAAVFSLSRGRSAADLVHDAVAMARGSGDRRYEVRAFLEEPSGEAALTALLDVRDADHSLLRAQVHGASVIIGRNPDFGWSIDPEGETRRVEPMQAGQWLLLDHVAVLLESVDTMLSHLSRGYVLERGPDAALEGHGDKRFERVSARQGVPAGSTPHHIELWLDRESHEVQRMELHWPAAQPGPHALHPHGQRAPQLVHAAPRFEAGDHVPPRLIVFDLVDRPVLADDWFDPKTHTK